jgi:ribosomal protein S18 acetylase RimI-like enzyme
LRTATADDRDFLWALHVATMRTYVSQTWGWDQVAQERMFRERFEPTALQVIELDGTPIGVLSATEERDAIELGSIEILPEHQRRGYGAAIVKKVLARARSTGRSVHLQVLKVNPARNLYHRLGFEVTGETSTHYLMGTEVEPRPDPRQDVRSG